MQCFIVSCNAWRFTQLQTIEQLQFICDIVIKNAKCTFVQLFMTAFCIRTSIFSDVLSSKQTMTELFYLDNIAGDLKTIELTISSITVVCIFFLLFFLLGKRGCELYELGTFQCDSLTFTSFVNSSILTIFF